MPCPLEYESYIFSNFFQYRVNILKIFERLEFRMSLDNFKTKSCLKYAKDLYYEISILYIKIN